MKKILYFILCVAFPSAINAWIVKTGANTKTISVVAADMTNSSLAGAGNYYVCSPYWTSDEGVSVGCGSGDVYRFNSVKPSLTTVSSFVTGFFVGSVYEDPINPEQRELYIGTKSLYNRLITKVTIDYALIAKNLKAKPFIKKHLGRTTYDNIRAKNGDNWGQAVIEPYLPTSIIPIKCEGGTLEPTIVPNQIFNRKAVGCLITKITVEYVDNTEGTRMTEYYASLGKDVKALGDNGNYMSQHAALMEHRNALLINHYGNAVASDVNADGNVNSADVTSVYNAIDSGEGEISGIRYVDLGLPSGKLWATMNYGAVVPEDFGDFYMSMRTAGFLSHNISGFTSANYSNYTDWDVPSPWFTPTYDEALELFDNCTATKRHINGVYCIMLTSKTNGNQLILPAQAGYVDEDGYNDDASYAMYWTTMQYQGDRQKRRTIGIHSYRHSKTINLDCSANFYHGCYLRLVCPKQK